MKLRVIIDEHLSVIHPYVVQIAIDEIIKHWFVKDEIITKWKTIRDFATSDEAIKFMKSYKRPMHGTIIAEYDDQDRVVDKLKGTSI